MQATFDKIFDEVEQQESAVTGALEKLEYQQKLYQLVVADTEAQRQFIEWDNAMYSIVEHLAVEARKALLAQNAMMACRHKFLTTADSLVPGLRLHQFPLHWDEQRVAQFTTEKDKLLEKLKKRGADLRLLLNPYDARPSLIDESPNSPLPNIGKFNDVVQLAIAILTNESLHFASVLLDETHDVQAN